MENIFVNIILIIIIIINRLIEDKKLRNRKYSKCETKTRQLFESIFNVEFNTIRPKFLKNPETGKNLELDGYNKLLNLAFEVNGIQHSRYSSFFHRSKYNFIQQIRRDEFKRKKCKKLDVLLIIIPFDVKFRNLENYIICKIKRLGLYNLYLNSYNNSKKIIFKKIDIL